MLQHTTDYFEELNINIDDKLRVIPYIAGKNVLDAGSGGGEMIKKLFDQGFKAHGIDLSHKSISYTKTLFDTTASNYNPKLVQGDVRKIDEYFEYGEIDTVLFSSVLHEVYSYNDFSIDAVSEALQGAWNVLPKGGRIIIRDGIRPPKSSHDVAIWFKNKGDINIVKRFTNDFKGRQIQLKYVGDGHVVLPLDDAMEFLYTYTWGEDAYDREVKEQFGIMTLHEYLLYLKSLLKGAHILKHENYLQEGYHYFLSKKIDFTDAVDNRNIRLPDSKAMFVIEKTID